LPDWWLIVAKGFVCAPMGDACCQVGYMACCAAISRVDFGFPDAVPVRLPAVFGMLVGRFCRVDDGRRCCGS
jgi:hypothetical protein